MKVILNDEIMGLGEEGDVVIVSPGYARNYLFPSKKAVVHNTQNLSVLASRKNAIKKRREDRHVAYMSVKERLENITLTIKMKTGESGHLYGAVTSTIIATRLEELGIEILKKQIILPHHSIKEIGTYEIEIKLLSSVSATLKLVVEDIEGIQDIAVTQPAIVDDASSQDLNTQVTSQEDITTSEASVTI